MHHNCISFLKIYFFIYRTDMFRLFPSHHQCACYMVQRKNNVYNLQDTFIYISVLQFQFTMSYDAHTNTQSNGKQQNIFNILFIILTHRSFNNRIGTLTQSRREI